MKTQLNLFISGLIILSSPNLSIAQGDSFEKSRQVTISAPSAFKKIYINTKIARAFVQYFEDATNQRWFEADKNFLVKFNMDGLENRALFAKNGRLIYHITYGTEKNLPGDVRRLIKSTYYDQAITRILKVTQDLRLIWVIHMEDNKEYIMARVEDNELEETKRMLKD